MSRLDKLILLSLIVFAIGFFAIRSTRENYRPMVLQELPIGIERHNPVPMVRAWNEGNRRLYYFGWGEKPTGGYSIELIEVKNGVIRVRAKEPSTDMMVTQAITYPYLMISVPKGTYRYEVVNSEGEVQRGTFRSARHPLEFNLVLPGQGEDIERRVWRDPFLGNEGKTVAQIMLEALFVQDEIREHIEEVKLLGVSFDNQGWYVLLSKDYDDLEPKRRQLLAEYIEENVLELEVKNLKTVVVTTNPGDLPPLEN